MRLPNPDPCAEGFIPASTNRRSAVTLVEMLVALTLTLIIMGAVVTLFGNLGQSVNDARAAIEMGDRLRAATTRLRNDLASATTTMAPPRRPEYGEGYFEYFEGIENDYLQRTANSTVNNPLVSKLELQGDDAAIIDPTWGDTDDLLALTIRSGGAPFVTSINGTTVESTTAEVVWFVSRGGSPARPSWTLYRRQLLVAPIIDTPGSPAYGTFAEDCNLTGLSPDDRFARIVAFRNRYDISHRIEGDFIITNTLADLTKRENRFMHGIWWGTDPDPVQWTRELASYPQGAMAPFHDNANSVDRAAWDYTLNSYRYLMNLGSAGGDRLGEDVILTDLKGFDLQLFDPAVEPRAMANPTRILAPSDPGFWQLTHNDRIQTVVAGPVTHYVTGAYVDLGFRQTLHAYYTDTTHHIGNVSVFSQYGAFPADALPPAVPVPGVGSFSTRLFRTYDTYSYHYEVDGVDNNDNNLIDEGSNGYNDNPMVNGAVDDLTEAETVPPYNAPLRGIQVRVRVYEPDSRQVRQVTVSQDYVRD